MLRLLRWVGAALAMFIASAIATVAALVLLVHMRWGAELGRYYAERAVNQRIAGRLSVRAVSLSLHEIVACDVELQDPDGAVVARIPRVAVGYALRPLLHGRVVLRDVELTAPAVRLVLGQPSNLGRAIARSGSSAPPSSPDLEVAIERLTVGGGRVLVQQARDDQTLAYVRDLTIVGHGRGNAAQERFRVAAQLNGRSLEAPTGGFVVHVDAHGDGELDGAAADVRLGDAIALSARALGANRYALHVERFDLTPDLARVAVARWPLVVPVELHGDASSRGSDVHADLTASMPANARLHVEGAVDLTKRSTSGLVLQASGLDPARLLGRGPEGTIDLSVRVASGPLAPAGIDTRLALDAHFPHSAVGASSAQASVHVADGVLQTLDARGQSADRDLIFTVSGHGGPGTLPDEALALQARLVARDLSRLDRSLHGRAAVTLALEGNPAAGVSSVSARTAASFRRLRIGSRPPMRLALSADVAPTGADRQRVYPLELRLANVKIAYGLRGKIDARWRQRGSATVGVGGGDVALDRLALASGTQTLALSGERGPQVARLQVALDQLHLDSLRALVPSLPQPLHGALSGHAAVRLTSGHRVEGTAQLHTTLGDVRASFNLPTQLPPAASDRLQLDAAVTKLPVEAVSRALHAQLRPIGKASLTLALSGTGAHPRGRAVVQLGALRLPSTLDETLDVPQIAGGRIVARYDRRILSASAHVDSVDGATLAANVSMSMTLSAHNLPSLAALRGHPLEGSLRVHDFPTAWLAGLLPSVPRIGGTVDGHFALAGTARRPTLRGQAGWSDGLVIGRGRSWAKAKISSRGRGRAP